MICWLSPCLSARSTPSFTWAMMISALIVGASSSWGLRPWRMFSVKYSGFTSFPMS